MFHAEYIITFTYIYIAECPAIYLNGMVSREGIPSVGKIHRARNAK